MYREALFGIVSVAILFVPIFVAVFVAAATRDAIRGARQRRIAEYRQSPESKLLILNDPVRS